MLTMKYLTLKTRLLALLLLAATCAAAQPTPAQLASRPELTASIYHSYEYLPGPAGLPRPKVTNLSTSATTAVTEAATTRKRRLMPSRSPRCAKPTRPGR